MTMTSTALALQGDTRPLAIMLSNPATMKKFELACGQRAGDVMINIINAANSNPDIWVCEPMTVITSALNAATMHLSLSPTLGQACILPFNKSIKTNDGWASEKRAQLIVMLRGVKDMAMRTNKYRVLNAFIVCEGQTWTENQMTGLGSIEGKRINDKPIGYGAYLLLFSGYEATVYMTLEEVTAWGKKYSPTYDQNKKAFGPKSKWATDFDDQAKKTVMKRLIMNKGVINDGDRAALEMVESEHYDAEIVDGTVEENAAAMDEQLAKEIEQELPELTAEEIAFNDAKQVMTKSGKVVNELPHDQFVILLDDKYKGTEPGKAARAIDTWRKIVAERAARELGF